MSNQKKDVKKTSPKIKKQSTKVVKTETKSTTKKPVKKVENKATKKTTKKVAKKENILEPDEVLKEINKSNKANKKVKNDVIVVKKINEKVEEKNEEIVDNFVNDKKENKHTILKGFLLTIYTLLVLFIGLCVAYYFYHNYEKVEDLKMNSIINSYAKKEIKKVEYGTKVTKDQLINDIVNLEQLKNDYKDDNFEIEVYANDIKLNDDEFVFSNIGDNKVVVNVSQKENRDVLNIVFDNTSFENFIKNFEIKVSKKEYKYSIEKEYYIIDSIAPIITGANDKEVNAGTILDLKEGIKAVDIVDGEVEFTLEGEVNYNVPGTYVITVKAIDKTGNTSTEKFNVVVKEIDINYLSSEILL